MLPWQNLLGIRHASELSGHRKSATAAVRGCQRKCDQDSNHHVQSRPCKACSIAPSSLVHPLHARLSPLLQGSIAERITQFFVGGAPRLRMEEVIYSPGDRFRLQTAAAGVVHLQLGGWLSYRRLCYSIPPCLGWMGICRICLWP